MCHEHASAAGESEGVKYRDFPFGHADFKAPRETSRSRGMCVSVAQEENLFWRRRSGCCQAGGDGCSHGEENTRMAPPLDSGSADDSLLRNF